LAYLRKKQELQKLILLHCDENAKNTHKWTVKQTFSDRIQKKLTLQNVLTANPQDMSEQVSAILQ